MVDTEPGTELRVAGESLQRLYQQFLAESFVVNRRYQRKLVWTVDEKSLLIDSVLSDLPIPLILLAEYFHEKETRFEIIDGLQRLNAIFSFLENEFPVAGEYFNLDTLGDTKLLRDREELTQREPTMSREKCLQIVNYQLPVSTYRSASHQAVDEVFRRINSSGRKISLQEIRQAGVTSKLAALVRKVSSAVRGDATLFEVLALRDMSKISITNKDLDYGIDEQEIFWISQGILDRESVRESRDEEMVLDLLLDMILDPIATTGSEYRNSAFGGQEAPASTAQKVVETRIQIAGEDQVYDEFFQTFDLIKRIIEESNTSWAAWTITQQNRRGIPRYFHVIFVALHNLQVKEGMEVSDLPGLTEALKGFWDKDLGVPGGGVWGAKRKMDVIKAAIAQLKQYFEPSNSPVLQHKAKSATQFESLLQMSLTEQSLFELKQGFLRQQNPFPLDEPAFLKMLRTASAMANTGIGAEGWIFYGVADTESDANHIKSLHGVESTQVHSFRVVGTDHELTILGRSIDDHLAWMTQKILSSGLQGDFAQALADSVTPFVYQGKLVWSLNPKARQQPIDMNGSFYYRVGNLTQEAKGQQIVSLAMRFQSVPT